MSKGNGSTPPRGKNIMNEKNESFLIPVINGMPLPIYFSRREVSGKRDGDRLKYEWAYSIRFRLKSIVIFPHLRTSFFQNYWPFLC